MAYHNKENAAENLNGNQGLGIPAHDFVAYTYGTGGGTSTANLTDAQYYRGGLQAAGTLVSHVVYAYDVNDNVTSVERTA